jgi:arylsulfatase A-like enzyme
MIERRNRSSSAGIASLFALLSLLGSGCGSQAEGDPSIVLITLDTLRQDHVGAYLSDDSVQPTKQGEAPLTPTLDKLAARSLVHDNAFTTMPTTMPAHASLFTGLHPFEHGVTRNGLRIAPALAGKQLASKLRERGYATAAFVSVMPLGRRGSGIEGFDLFKAPKTDHQSGFTAVNQAKRWLSRQPSRPVFLWVHVYDSHSPYGTASDKEGQMPVDSRQYGFVDTALFDEPEARDRMQLLYRNGIRDTDLQVERLLKAVENQLGDDVLVVVVSDHGETLGERLDERSYAYDHSEFLDDEQIRIPLFIAGPGVEPGRSKGAASIRDLYTTLLAAAGIPDPDAADSGRRDLRKSAATRRIVRIEREPLHRREDRVTRKVWGQSNTQQIAVSDGEYTVILGVNGRALNPRSKAPADLGVEARAYLAAVNQSRRETAGVAPEIDPSVRDALEALGYLQE